MTSPIFIIGAGGHGAEVADYLREMKLPLAGALDDALPPGGWHCTEILGSLADLPALCQSLGDSRYITAFGSNALRRRVVERISALRLSRLRAFTLLHALAHVGADVVLGAGTLLAPGAIVTTRTRIGSHSIINIKASVSHDCVIGDWCNLNPGATVCGAVELGEGCSIGAGATVLQKRKIGPWTIVGAGSVVTEDLPGGVTAVGVPARIIKWHDGAAT